MASVEDVDRNKKAIESSVFDSRKRQEEEVKQLKERFKCARNILDEQEERSRKGESLKFMNELEKVRKEVEKQRRELNENHQRTLRQTLRNNSERKLKYEKQMNDEKISWEKKFRSRLLEEKVNNFLLNFYFCESWVDLWLFLTLSFIYDTSICYQFTNLLIQNTSLSYQFVNTYFMTYFQFSVNHFSVDKNEKESRNFGIKKCNRNG